MLLTANLFPLMCFSIASVLNTVAISYHSLAAVPFGSIVVVLLIWILVSCPLCLFGTVCVSLRSCDVWSFLICLPCLNLHAAIVLCLLTQPRHHMTFKLPVSQLCVNKHLCHVWGAQGKWLVSPNCSGLCLTAMR